MEDETIKGKSFDWKITLSDITNIVIAITAIFAILLSTCQYSANLKREDNIDRPVIAFATTKFSFDTASNSPQGEPILTFKNLGHRLANQSHFNIVTFARDSLNHFSKNNVQDLEMSNPIVPDVSIDLSLNPLPLKPKTQYLFKIKLRYKDEITDVTYNDSLYFKWTYSPRLENNRLFNLEKDTASIIDLLNGD
ncbi:MAG: hypothetical protein KGM16_15940 [Bacteroidota bacterium]|nr:hypothetical protein [Bacteroidota bacterium]